MSFCLSYSASQNASQHCRFILFDLIHWIHNKTPPWSKSSLINFLLIIVCISQELHTPVKSKQRLNLAVGTTFVSMSAGLLSLWTLTILMTPLDTSFLIKCSFTSICLVLSWCAGFLAQIDCTRAVTMDINRLLLLAQFS